MTLSRTLDEVRQHEVAHVGRVGRPNPWWPGPLSTNDCVGFQTDALGLRTGTETLAQLGARPHLISIAAFRAHYQYPEVAPQDLAAGDLVLTNWTGARVDGRPEAEHMEWVYSRSHDSIVIIGANTGPRAGDPTPNGVWKKTRPLDGHVVRGIRPPYRDVKPSHHRRQVVRTVAIYLNGQDLGSLPKTTAAGPGDTTGLEGPKYWRRVQTWGRRHRYYPSQYVIDGIPGTQSRIVEAAAYKAATAKK